MNEREFIKTLQERAREQEKLITSMPLPKVFSSVSLWFGNHPWRIVIPLSLILTLVFRAIFGPSYDDVILTVFGKL
ncbi:MAG: hypothetical protein M1444_00965 [Patescibacteria group bacterium]|nr:hypothetical protein [Patescibacteria group bacterium]